MADVSMNNKKTRDIPLFTFLCGCLLLMSCNPAEKIDTGPNGPEFVSSSSVETVRAQIAKLPTNDVWWNVYGEDQAWNFKNLHRFMPTVNVYRQGQVRLLVERPLAAISAEIVDTPIGSVAFKAFLDSKESKLWDLLCCIKATLSLSITPDSSHMRSPFSGQSPRSWFRHW